MESKYTIAELVAAAKQFNQPSFLVETALQAAGQERYTLEEAKIIVSEFANRPMEEDD